MTVEAGTDFLDGIDNRELLRNRKFSESGPQRSPELTRLVLKELTQ